MNVNLTNKKTIQYRQKIFSSTSTFWQSNALYPSKTSWSQRNLSKFWDVRVWHRKHCKEKLSGSHGPSLRPTFCLDWDCVGDWSRFLLKRLNPWWLSLGSVVGVTSSTPLHKARERRAQWPRVASECSHWIRGRMTHHHPLRFVTRGGVSLFLKVLKSDQCTESHWEWTLFRQIAEHHSIWAFENIFTTDYTFGLLRCSICVRHIWSY